MFTFAQAPQEISDVLQDAADLFKASFSKVWHAALISLVFFASFSGLIRLQMPLIQESLQKNGWTMMDSLIMGVSTLGFLISLFFLGVLMHRMQKASENPASTLRESLTAVYKRYFYLLLVTIIVSFIGMAGFSLLIIPGVIAFVYLVFALPLVLIDNENAFIAIKDSCLLVWTNFWRTFVVVFLPFMILNMLALGILHYAFITRPVVALFLAPAANVLIYWVTYAVILVQFNDLKKRRALSQRNL